MTASTGANFQPGNTDCAISKPCATQSVQPNIAASSMSGEGAAAFTVLAAFIGPAQHRAPHGRRPGSAGGHRGHRTGGPRRRPRSRANARGLQSVSGTA
jgi:hypothetical protein